METIFIVMHTYSFTHYHNIISNNNLLFLEIHHTFVLSQSLALSFHQIIHTLEATIHLQPNLPIGLQILFSSSLKVPCFLSI